MKDALILFAMAYAGLSVFIGVPTLLHWMWKQDHKAPHDESHED